MIATFGVLEALSWLGGRTDFPPDPLVTEGREAWQRNRIYDPYVFWRMRPGLGKNGRKVTNMRGLRGPEIPEPDPLEARILSLGESTTFAGSLPYEKNYSALVEHELGTWDGRKVRVINGGVPGYTLFQGLTYLRHYGLELEPDVVLLYFGYNDFLPVAFREQRDSMANSVSGGLTDRAVYERRRSLVGLLSHALLRHSNAFRKGASLAARLGGGRAVVGDPRTVRVPEQDRRDALAAILDLCRERGMELWIAVPWYREFEDHVALLQRFAVENEVRLFDLPAALRTIPGERADYFRDKVHPNEAGHRAIANVIVASLRADSQQQRAVEYPESAVTNEPERPWSVQLHVHGSYSEGIGSIDSHAFEARDLGVDVIWWSDHDFRIASHRHVTRYGFEDWQVPLDLGEAWRARPDRLRGEGGAKGLAPPEERHPEATIELVDGDAREGQRSVRIALSDRSIDFVRQHVRFQSQRALHRRPLGSEVEIELSIHPEEQGDDAHAFVEIALSEHPAADGSGLRQLGLRYVCRSGEPEHVGSYYEVPLACPAGRWSDHRLVPARDVERGFPEHPPADNSASEIRLGIAARRGARGAARFDRLRISQALEGEAAYRRQRELIDRIALRHPGLTQLQGVEISFTGPHLNEFSVGTSLLDYDALLRESDTPDRDPPVSHPRDFSLLVQRHAVERAHARGGLVSYNHPFGTGKAAASENDRENRLSKLSAARAFGADLLEVGYRDRGGHDLDDHLWLWDRLALAGVPLVGIGVSDSHGGPDHRWRDAPNNFVSWVYAASPTKPDLIEGLRAGRVFFGDPTRFDGRVELSTPDGARMGDVVEIDAPRTAAVHIAVDGTRHGDTIVVHRAEGESARFATGPGSFRGTHRIALDGESIDFVRVAVYGADGLVRVLSNPIRFVPATRAPAGDSSDLPDSAAAARASKSRPM